MSNTPPHVFAGAEQAISEHYLASALADAECTMYSDVKFQEEVVLVDPEKISQIILHYREKSRCFAQSLVDSSTTKCRGSGIQNPTVGDIIATALSNTRIRKGANSPEDTDALERQIDGLVEQGKPLEFALPAHPWKSPNPFKSRSTEYGHGVYPDGGEISAFLRYAEIIEVVDIVYPEQKGRNNFTIYSDGYRFNDAFLMKAEGLDSYKQGLHDITEMLGIEQMVKIVCFERVLQDLGLEYNQARLDARNEEVSFWKEIIQQNFDAADIVGSLSLIKENDPYATAENTEGQFIPLLNSMLNTIPLDKIDAFYRTLENPDQSYLDFQRDFFLHLWEPWTDNKALEELRVDRWNDVLEATCVYLGIVIENKLQDAVMLRNPDTIRLTIHPKPSQISIKTTDTCDIQNQPWQGTGCVKSSQKGKTVFLETAPAIKSETDGYRPVIPHDRHEDYHAGPYTCDLAHRPLYQLAAIGQPVWYQSGDLTMQCILNKASRGRR